jgi:hypothetical protein
MRRVSPILVATVFWLLATDVSAQASCDGSLRRFAARLGASDGDFHTHFYRVDPDSGAIRPGLGTDENERWGAIFGYWDDGECAYHMDAYVVHFERREGASDSPWRRVLGEWAPAAFRHPLMDEFLGWQRGEDRIAWTRTLRGWAVTIVDLTLTWTLQDPFSPRRRRALMRAATRCVPP